ncbi:MAG: hypothetical protein WCJ64_07465 [Rhodospirillaceae bacterium]
MSDELTTNEEVAYSFLESAVFLDKARGVDNRGDLKRALDYNVMIWIFFKNNVALAEKGALSESASHISNISDFMTKSAIRVQKSFDDELIGLMVTLNLNMCERFLSEPFDGLHVIRSAIN